MKVWETIAAVIIAGVSYAFLWVHPMIVIAAVLIMVVIIIMASAPRILWLEWKRWKREEWRPLERQEVKNLLDWIGLWWFYI